MHAFHSTPQNSTGENQIILNASFMHEISISGGYIDKLTIGYRHYIFLIYRLIYGEFPPISSKKYDYFFELDEEWFVTKITSNK